MKVQPWDVWRADLNPIEGNEQAGHRPVIVVSTQMHLRLAPTLVTVMPVTTRERPLPHRVPVNSLKHPSFAITEQVRTISRSRLTGGMRYGRLTEAEIAQVKYALARMVTVQ